MHFRKRNVLAAVRELLFERGVSRLVFEHARNLVVSVLVMAVGLEATQHPPGDIGPLVFRWTGYVVATLGAMLVLLNLADGMHQLSKARLPRLWHALLIIAYVVLFWRVTSLILLFR